MSNKHVESFAAGGVIATVVCALTFALISNGREKKRVELDEKFRNKEFRETKEYVLELAHYYNKKSNRAKISKKHNDVRKFDFISRVLKEYARNMNDNYVVISRK